MSTTLLEDWAARARFLIATRDDEVVHGWGDMETAYDVRRDGADYIVTISDHGSPRFFARFSSEVDADRLMMLMFGRLWRAAHGMRRTTPASLAPGAEIAEDGARWLLTWDGDRASFSGRDIALAYSRIRALSLDELDLALQDPASDY